MQCELSVVEWRSEAVRAEQLTGHAHADAPDAVRRALDDLTCVREPMDHGDAALLHRLSAYSGASDADRSIAAAHGLEPDRPFPWPANPELDALREGWASPPSADTIGVSWPDDIASIRVDGADATRVPVGAPFLLQELDASGAVRLTTYVRELTGGDVPLTIATGTDDERIESIKATLRAEVPMLAVCASPQSDGTFLLKWTITADGSVRDVSVTPLEAPDPVLEACLERRVRTWRFAPMGDDQQVSKSVTFRRA